MTNAQLERKARRQLRRSYLTGRVDSAMYDKISKQLSNQKFLTRLNADTVHLNPWETPGLMTTKLKQFDFSTIWDWFAENWDEILRIILTLLPLFL